MKDSNMYEQVLSVIRTLAHEGTIPRRLEQAKLAPTMKINRLGLDSMGLVSLISEIETRTNTVLPDSSLATITTLEDLVNALAGPSKR